MEIFRGILPPFPFCPQLLVQLAVVLQVVTLPLQRWCQTVSFPPPINRNNTNSYQIKKRKQTTTLFWFQGNKKAADP